MADLDSFFKKKDKKKKKAYKASASVIAAAPAKDVEAPKPEPPKEEGAGDTTEAASARKKNKNTEYNDKDSWNQSMEEYKAPDLSGLKIGNFKAQEAAIDTAVAEDEEDEEDEEEADEASAADVAAADDDNTGEPEQMGPTGPVVGGKYVPPSSRGAGGQRMPTRGRGGAREAPPDLGTMSFPSLANAAAEKNNEKSFAGFKQVEGRGGRYSNSSAVQNQAGAPGKYQPPGRRGNQFEGL